ncbi:hypothetical protein PWT90_03419 [Aphanocladium album]|nr:hypothetical protein PWT90_03419 [Aphanocladium album]
MYSEKRLESNRNDATEASDTESLLSSNTSHDKLLQSSQYERTKRNGRLKTILHSIAIVSYSIVTVLLAIWTVKLRGMKCECDKGAVYSPANVAVQYQKQTIDHEVFDGQSNFRGMPRPEVDEAWENLLQYNDLRVQKEDLEKANITSVPLNDEQGGYFVSLDVYHTLHCVNHVRKSYYGDYYHNPNPIEQQRKHFDHCIDLLRQTLMCHGDVSLHPYEWIDGYRFPWPTERTEHQCRNWDKLVAWSKEHSIPDLEGPILTHPTLGTSWRGNEPDWTTGAGSGHK